LKNSIEELWYTYVTPFQALAANGDSGNLVVTVNRGGDFLLEKFVGLSIQGGSFKVQIGDGGTQTQFSNDLVDSRLILGTAQLWAPVIPPYIFPYNGAIQWRVVDTSAAPNTIQLGFIGRVLPAGTAQAQGAGSTGHPSATPQTQQPTRLGRGGNFYSSQSPEQASARFYGNR
jgi:hypothetical protein